MSINTAITLDVGGTVFRTTTKTITSSGLGFSNCMTQLVIFTKHNHAEMNDTITIGYRQPDGSYFIDRDGTYFRFILDYFRGTLSDKNRRQFADEIMEEAKFYRLKYLQQEMKERAVRILSINTTVITLDVGGTVFRTTAKTTMTLKADDAIWDSQLAKLIHPRYDDTICKIGLKLQEGSYFIDRDGTHFQHILNYLRGALTKEKKQQFTNEILEEAKFYGLEELQAEMEHINTPKELELTRQGDEVMDSQVMDSEEQNSEQSEKSVV